MAASSRDRISVDLHGLKAALFERAQALGVSPSGFVRAALAEALGRMEDLSSDRSSPSRHSCSGGRVRLCLRMSREGACATLDGARQAGLTVGDYVSGLVADVPVLMSGHSRVDHVAALMASSAELSTLSRNIHRLAVLLRQADVEPARPYREMLDTVARDVRRHLELAARVLAELQPSRRGGVVKSAHADR